jgi:hypothetical protein
MQHENWRSSFSPTQWAVFTREAARQDLTAEALAAKYLNRDFGRDELASRKRKHRGVRLRRVI